MSHERDEHYSLEDDSGPREERHISLIEWFDEWQRRSWRAYLESVKAQEERDRAYFEWARRCQQANTEILKEPF
jgi:hypothetical protein